MRPLLLFALLITLSACAPIPVFPVPFMTRDPYEHFKAGERVSPPGVSFSLPNGRDWKLAPNTKSKHLKIDTADKSLYPQSFLREKKSRKEMQSLLIYVNKFTIQSHSLSKQEFHEILKKQRAQRIGPLIEIKDSHEFYNSRSETCVIYRSVVENKNHALPIQYKINETFEMSCIHPYNPSVGITIELVRMSSPDISFPEFNAMGEALFKSVIFREF